MFSIKYKTAGCISYFKKRYDFRTAPYIYYACWNLVLFLRNTLKWIESKHYTCQLSRVIRESHACGLKTSISRIKDNFSRLTHKSRQIVIFNTWLITKIYCAFLKHANSEVQKPTVTFAYFTVVNHLNGPLRKQNLA